MNGSNKEPQEKASIEPANDNIPFKTVCHCLWPQLAPERRKLGAACGAYLLHAALLAMPPLLIQQLLDRAIVGQNSQLFGQLLFLYGLIILGEWLTGWLAEWWMGSIGQRATARLREELLRHVMQMDARFFSGASSGKLLSRMTSDVDALAELFTSGTISMIADVLGAVAVFTLMWYTSPQMTCAVLLVLVPLLIGVTWLQRRAQRLFGYIRQQLAEINGFLVEYLSNMHVVQALGQEQRMVIKFAAVQQPFTQAQQQGNRLDAGIYTLVDSLGIVTTAALLWVSTSWLAQDKLQIGVVVAMIHATRRLFVPIRDAAGKYTMLQSAWIAAQRVVGLLQTKVALQPGPINHLPTSKEPLAAELRHVFFRYQPTSSHWTLSDISLQIKQGERVALVGATGSGKTTVLSLLARIYDVEQGDVLLSGIAVAQLNWSCLREHVALVLQDPFFFAGTIEENLLLGGRIAKRDLAVAIEQMELGAFMQELPQGLATKLQEGGRNLSSGQRQVLALIRAMALQPKLVLLDEATSQVDMQMEQHLQRCMNVLLQGRTGVMVAHRLASIQGVDSVAVFHQGRLVEQGTESALLAQQGRYATLHAAYQQARLDNA